MWQQRSPSRDHIRSCAPNRTGNHWRLRLWQNDLIALSQWSGTNHFGNDRVWRRKARGFAFTRRIPSARQTITTTGWNRLSTLLPFSSLVGFGKHHRSASSRTEDVKAQSAGRGQGVVELGGIAVCGEKISGITVRRGAAASGNRTGTRDETRPTDV